MSGRGIPVRRGHVGHPRTPHRLDASGEARAVTCATVLFIGATSKHRRTPPRLDDAPEARAVTRATALIVGATSGIGRAMVHRLIASTPPGRPEP